MSRNKVNVTQQAGNKVSIAEVNRTIELTEETVKIVHVGTQILAGSDSHYTHTQSLPSATWDIEHNLNKKASVTVVDSADNVVYGDIEYTDLNSLTITFNGAFSGKAYLN